MRNGIKKAFKNFRRDNLIDLVVFMVGLLGLIVSYPTIETQLIDAARVGDLIWYVCFDLIIVIIYCIAIWMVARLLHRFMAWFIKYTDTNAR